MTYDVVKLNFVTPLHLSGGRMDAYDQSEEVLHSDTIKSALFVMARKLFGDEIDQSFLDAFSVSSAMPYYGDEYFFPKPMLRIGNPQSNDASKGKFIKKLAYFNLPVFEKILSGVPFNLDIERTDASGRFYFSTSGHTKEDILVSQVQQRFAAPKADERDGTPYYVDRIYFTEKAGLYFLIQYHNKEFEAKIKAAIRLLGDEGVGTDRAVGNGQFKPVFGESLSIQAPAHANGHLNLSLFCPTQVAMESHLLQNSAYQLMKRGGYIASPENPRFMTFRKRTIFMFAEGSVFPKGMDMEGKLVDLQPIKEKIQGLTHPIWREGRPISIPVNITNNV